MKKSENKVDDSVRNKIKNKIINHRIEQYKQDGVVQQDLEEQSKALHERILKRKAMSNEQRKLKENKVPSDNELEKNESKIVALNKIDRLQDNHKKPKVEFEIKLKERTERDKVAQMTLVQNNELAQNKLAQEDIKAQTVSLQERLKNRKQKQTKDNTKKEIVALYSSFAQTKNLPEEERMNKISDNIQSFVEKQSELHKTQAKKDKINSTHYSEAAKQSAISKLDKASLESIKDYANMYIKLESQPSKSKTLLQQLLSLLKTISIALSKVVTYSIPIKDTSNKGYFRHSEKILNKKSEFKGRG